LDSPGSPLPPVLLQPLRGVGLGVPQCATRPVEAWPRTLLSAFGSKCACVLDVKMQQGIRQLCQSMCFGQGELQEEMAGGEGGRSPKQTWRKMTLGATEPSAQQATAAAATGRTLRQGDAAERHSAQTPLPALCWLQARRLAPCLSFPFGKRRFSFP